MFIELAHYTLILLLVGVCLQTLLLTRTLWSTGSSTVINLARKGNSCLIILLFLTFFSLLYSYISCDFSLAIVFETFSTKTPSSKILQAFTSSREGYFFLFILIFSFVHLISYSKKDFATFQERGRYLFAGYFLIFSLLVLLITTANPFTRIETPTLEGIGINKEADSFYQFVSILLSFTAYSILTVCLIKSVTLADKNSKFVICSFKSALISLILLTLTLGLELLTRWTISKNGFLWVWWPSNTIQLAIFILLLGWTIFVFFCGYSKVFTHWAIAFNTIIVSFCFAHFFAVEYKVFSLSTNEVYFPNPVTAISASAGIFCFLLFFCSTVLKKPIAENRLTLLSQESFVGMSGMALLSTGLVSGLFSLMSALFMFIPDLPLKLLPDLVKTIFIYGFYIWAILLCIGLKRRSLVSGWRKTNVKQTVIFLIISFILIGYCLCAVPNGGKIVLFSLPALLIFNTELSLYNITVPKSFKSALDSIRRTNRFSYGVFFVSLGFLIFSICFSNAYYNSGQSIETVTFPSLNQTFSGIFIFCIGLCFLLSCLKKEKVS